MTLETMQVRGVKQHYGPRDINERYGGILPGNGSFRELSFVFDYDDLPSPGESELEAQIPAYAVVLSATLEVIEGFEDGTSYDVGIYKPDGTAVDTDGLIESVAQAAIADKGDYVEGSGDTVGSSVGDEAVEVGVDATGDFTSGKARLVVRYVPAR